MSETLPGEDKGSPFRAASFYPSRGRSRLLALKNLLLPFHNFKFAIFLGVMYLVFAWVFQTAVNDPAVVTKRSKIVSIEQTCAFENPSPKIGAKGEARRTCETTRKNDLKYMSNTNLWEEIKKLKGDTSAKVPDQPSDDAAKAQVNQIIEHDLSNFQGKQLVRLYAWAAPVIGDPQQALAVATWFKDAKEGGGWLGLATNVIRPAIEPGQVFNAMLANPAFFFMVVGLYLGLISFVEPQYKSRRLRGLAKWGIGGLHAFAHLTILLAISVSFRWLLTWPTSLSGMIAGAVVFSLLMIFLGGLLGSILFGCYWALTSLVGCMDSWAFGALGIRGYKNFLRMRFDMNGGLTIYSIGLDKVPGRKGWRAINRHEDAAVYNDHRPLIVPTREMKPRLIEKIEIRPYEKQGDRISRKGNIDVAQNKSILALTET